MEKSQAQHSVGEKISCYLNSEYSPGKISISLSMEYSVDGKISSSLSLEHFHR